MLYEVITDVYPLPTFAAKRGRPAARAWDRCEPRNDQVLVAAIWAEIRRRDPAQAGRSDASVLVV